MLIVVALDGSGLAERGIDFATRIARQSISPVTLSLVRVNTLIPTQVYGAGGEYVPILTENMVVDETSNEHDYLADTAKRLAAIGIATRTHVSVGRASEAIIAFAQHQRADLIVITSHGRTGLARAMLGSVAEEVARNAHIPTLIVRIASSALPPRERTEPFTVLVPLDGSPLAEAGITAALPLAQGMGGALRLFQVLPILIESPGDRQRRAQQALAYLSDLAGRVEAQGLIAHRALAWGDPADQIALEAERYQTDAIAIATHGRLGLERLLKGSVTEAVLRQVTLPVVVIHPGVAPHSEHAQTQQPSPTAS